MPHTTLDQYLAAQAVPPRLAAVIIATAEACRAIGHEVRLSALNGTDGSVGTENVQGEVQKTLDVLANDIMLDTSRWGGNVAALVSEEMDDLVVVPGADTKDGYFLIFDPIDGSSNLDVNGVVGTIFSIIPARAAGEVATPADVLQGGRAQVCAGYAIYGPQTGMMLTVGKGVVALALDDAGVWQVTKVDIAVPAETREFAINMSNRRHWAKPLVDYIDGCLAGKTGSRGKDFNMRWLASMVGDVHRILTRGGIFIYPADVRPNMQHGKLRLLYEANPMALLIEQAGGRATNGVTPILDIVPTALHQRVPVVLGSAQEVALVREALTAVPA